MWWLPLAMGGATGLLDAIFGKEEKKTYSKADLQKYGFEDFDPGKAKGDLARMINAQLKNRRAVSEAKNSQLGINNPSDIFSGEEGLYDAQVKGNSAIDEYDKQQENQIASMLFQLNEGQPEDDSSFIERFLQGGLEGANIGFNLQSLINKPGIVDDPVLDTEPEKQKVSDPNIEITPYVKPPVDSPLPYEHPDVAGQGGFSFLTPEKYLEKLMNQVNSRKQRSFSNWT